MLVFQRFAELSVTDAATPTNGEDLADTFLKPLLMWMRTSIMDCNTKQTVSRNDDDPYDYIVIAVSLPPSFPPSLSFSLSLSFFLIPTVPSWLLSIILLSLAQWTTLNCWISRCIQSMCNWFVHNSLDDELCPMGYDCDWYHSPSHSIHSTYGLDLNQCHYLTLTILILHVLLTCC